MADQKISQLDPDTTPTSDDLVVVVNDPAGTPGTKKVTLANLFTASWTYLKYTIVSFIMAGKPDGSMWNGKIAPTVSSSDLILTLQTKSGGTPSASDPIYIMINGTLRTVTAATSCTLADGTNWFNSGSAELATISVDYFAYAIWDSNSSVVAVAPARIPYATLVSDFSATSTNEKFIGNQSNYTSTDDVVVIGRFAATLSAGAGYTWTVPTYTSTNLIQQPVYETQIMTYTPTVTSSTGTITTVGSVSGRYQFMGRRFFVDQSGAITTNGTGGGLLRISTPFTPLSQNVILAGREFASTGTMLQGVITGAAYISWATYTGAYPAANGYIIAGGGTARYI